MIGLIKSDPTTPLNVILTFAFCSGVSVAKEFEEQGLL